jgi:hypothetical protein
MHDRWTRMTPEDRARFREKMRERCERVATSAADMKT